MSEVIFERGERVRFLDFVGEEHEGLVRWSVNEQSTYVNVDVIENGRGKHFMALLKDVRRV